MASTHPKRPLLMIPGPVEYHEQVLSTLGEASVSHISPQFINEFGESIELIRKVLLTIDAQPFILSGSGTLGWDIIIANLIEKHEKALCINTGYFSDSFTSCCDSYDVHVDTLRYNVGECGNIEDLKKQLNQHQYKMVLFTHVDTSTGVRNPVGEWSKLVKQIQPNCLVAVDGVCSFGAEEFRMDEWGVDAAMTCSQKAIGVPPGLSIIALSKQAMEVFHSRKSKVTGYYTDLHNWLPIMQAYEKRTPSYFATPNVNFIRALNRALKLLLGEAGGMEQVFATHRETSNRFRAALDALGLKLVPTSNQHAAWTLSAIWYPEDIDKTKLLTLLSSHGVIAAGGLHKDVKAKYFRIGHMGVSVWDKRRNDIVTVIEALEQSLQEAGHKFEAGAGIKAFKA